LNSWILTTSVRTDGASSPVGERAARRKSVSLLKGSSPGSPSTRRTGRAAVTSIGLEDSSLIGSGSSLGASRTVKRGEPGLSIVVGTLSIVRPPGGIGPTSWAVPGPGEPSTNNSAVRVKGSGPALAIVVRTLIGRPGVAKPRASSRGPTEPSAPLDFTPA